MNFHPQSGIAIGPILFVIAILAVLAAAIAAGSGSLTGGTSQESASAAAWAIINSADLVANAIQRVMNENGCSDTQINFYSLTDGGYASNNASAPTDHTCDVYNLAGGAIQQTNIQLANDPTTAASWRGQTGVPTSYFEPSANNAVKNIGTDGNGIASIDLLLILPTINLSVCTKINKLVGYNPPTYAPISAWMNIMGRFPGTFGFNGSTAADIGFGSGISQGCYYDLGYGGQYSYVRVLVPR